MNQESIQSGITKMRVALGNLGSSGRSEGVRFSQGEEPETAVIVVPDEVGSLVRMYASARGIEVNAAMEQVMRAGIEAVMSGAVEVKEECDD